MRLHGFLRDQRMIAGIGRRLANEICWTARVSPFSTTTSLGATGAVSIAGAIADCVAERVERGALPGHHEFIEGTDMRSTQPNRAGRAGDQTSTDPTRSGLSSTPATR